MKVILSLVEAAAHRIVNILMNINLSTENRKQEIEPRQRYSGAGLH